MPIFLTAILIRLIYLNAQSLHFDEAWLALSVLEENIADMVFFDIWPQSTPIGFLFLSRMWFGLAEFADWKARMIPVAMSAATMLVGYEFLRKKSSKFAGILFLLCFGFLETPLRYSYEFKQFAGDMLAVTVAIFCMDYLCDFSEASKRKRLLSAAMICLLIPLSHPMAFLLPAILCLVLFCALRSGSSANVRFAIFFSVTVVAIFSADYLYVIRPTVANSWLHDYWSAQLLSSQSGMVNQVSSVWMRLVSIFDYFFINHWAYRQSFFLPRVFLVLYLGACTYAIVKKNFLLLLWNSPLLALIICSLFGAYPFAATRTSLFLLPVILITVIYAIDHLCQMKAGSTCKHVILIVSLILLPMQGLPYGYFIKVHNDGGDALRWLTENAKPDQSVFVSYWLNHRFQMEKLLYGPNVKIDAVLASLPDEEGETGIIGLQEMMSTGDHTDVALIEWDEQGTVFESTLLGFCKKYSFKRYEYFRVHEYHCDK